MPDELRPILRAPEAKPRIRFSHLTPRLHRFTQAVRILATLASLGTVSFSAYYFLGFTENDKTLLHLLNAFALSFGLGGFLYVPAFYIAKTSHDVLKNIPHKKLILKIAALMLPWILIGFYLQRLEGLWKVAGLMLIVLAVIFVGWAVAILKTNLQPRS